MSDTTAPVLKRLLIPDTIDLSQGNLMLRIGAEADDGPGGAGVKDVAIFLDKDIVLGYGAFHVFSVPGIQLIDTFRDATPTTAATLLDLSRNTAPGAYTITQAWVEDLAGNRAIYDTAQLQALGIASGFTVTGGVADTVAPTLLGLSLPAAIDVGRGPVALPVTALVQDNPGGSGVRAVTVILDRDLVLSTGPSTGLVLPGVDNGDTFLDATPGSATTVFSVTGNSASGSYGIQLVAVEDLAGNQTFYDAAQLQKMGIATSIEVRGGRADVGAPTLLGLALPAAIDIRHGAVTVPIAAQARDEAGGSGVDAVTVFLDKELAFTYGSFSNFSVPGAGSPDDFADATPESAAGTLELGADAVVGVYRITELWLRDLAGNRVAYSAAQLQMMGIRTTIAVGDGSLPPANASVATAQGADDVVFKIGSSAWRAGANDFELAFSYDATQAHYAGSSLSGMAASSFSASVSESGGIGTVTIRGAGILAPEAAGSIDIKLAGEARALLGYAVNGFAVNGTQQDFGRDDLGKLYRAGAGDDLVAHDGRMTLVDGGAGLDTVRFAGKAADYRVDKTLAGFGVAHGKEGFTGLRHVERVVFDDGAVALDVDGIGGRVYRLYQAAFDRTPDTGGIGFWMSQIERGSSFRDAAAAFLGSPEFLDHNGDGLDNTAFAGALYRNVLHRAPDQGGVAFWIDALDKGASRADVLLGFSDSAENVTQVAATIGSGFAYTPWG